MSLTKPPVAGLNELKDIVIQSPEAMNLYQSEWARFQTRIFEATCIDQIFSILEAACATHADISRMTMKAFMPPLDLAAVKSTYDQLTKEKGRVNVTVADLARYSYSRWDKLTNWLKDKADFVEFTEANTNQRIHCATMSYASRVMDSVSLDPAILITQKQVEETNVRSHVTAGRAMTLRLLAVLFVGLLSLSESFARQVVIYKDGKPTQGRFRYYGDSTVIASDILFAPDSADLKSTSFQTLQSIAQKVNGANWFTIEAHTDNIGTADYNQKLSDRRVRALSAWLMSRANMVHLRGYGFGETKLLVRYGSRQQQSANRRIIIRITR